MQSVGIWIAKLWDELYDLIIWLYVAWTLSKDFLSEIEDFEFLRESIVRLIKEKPLRSR